MANNFQQHSQHLLPILNNLNPDTTDNDGADLFDLDNIQQPLLDLPPPEEEPTPPLTELGNVYHCTMLGDPRTNNNSEGGNNSINLSFATTSPPMPKFSDKLQLYNCEHETKLQQLFRNRNPNRAPRTSEVKRQEDIRAIVAGYDVTNRLQYCRTLGYL